MRFRDFARQWRRRTLCRGCERAVVADRGTWITTIVTGIAFVVLVIYLDETTFVSGWILWPLAVAIAFAADYMLWRTVSWRPPTGAE